MSLPQQAFWEELVKSALLGTERQNLPMPQGTSQLAQLLQEIPRKHPEEALLSMVAAITLHHTIGRQLPPVETTPYLPAPVELQPVCSTRAADMLGRLLYSNHREVLPEYLTRMTAAGFRIPAKYLPALLNHGRRIAKHRPLIPAVIGERGRWLAKQNPQWRYAVYNSEHTQDLKEVWFNGLKAERQAIYQLVRYHQPDLARTLLKQTWGQETQPNRLYFVRQLAVHLSMEDEPFLEEVVLNDRAPQVRRKAAELLACLPHSRLCQRMTQRTEPLLTWHWLSRHLAANMPEEITPEMLRDGIIQRSSRTGMGQQSWLLTQLLAATPLDTWTTIFNVPIETLMQGLKKNKWRLAILRGWFLAAERQKNSEWAQALLQHNDLSLSSNRTLPKLITVLSPKMRERLIKEVHERYQFDGGINRYHPLILVLEKSNHQWSHETAEIAITRLRAFFRTESAARIDQIFVKVLRDFALYIPPDTVDSFHQILEEVNTSPILRSAIIEIIAMLQFRLEMHREIGRETLPHS